MDMRLFPTIALALTLASCGGRGQRQAVRTADGDGYRYVVELNSVRASSALARDTVSLGDLREGETTEYRIGLRNTDTEPWVILEARGTCGCTEIDYPKAPVRPGETVTLTLRYDSGGQSGFQFKTVRLHTSLDPKPYPILLTATVNE
jgi:hypothetical protein